MIAEVITLFIKHISLPATPSICTTTVQKHPLLLIPAIKGGQARQTTTAGGL
jgi:hypothetical protein